MSLTEELTPKTTEKNSMDEQALWYLSGVVDSLMNLRVKIIKKGDTSFGYRADVELSLSRPSKNNPLFSLLNDYCETNEVRYRIDEGVGTYMFKITNCYDIESFLNPITGGFLQQRERAEFFIDNVIPLFKSSPPTTKNEIIEVAEISEQLNEYPSQSKTKYDADYFRDEWDIV
jgi:hypothetical protein